MAAPSAYRSFQTSGRIGAGATGLHHSSWQFRILNHWVRSWILGRFVNHWATMGVPVLYVNSFDEHFGSTYQYFKWYTLDQAIPLLGTSSIEILIPVHRLFYFILFFKFYLSFGLYVTYEVPGPGVRSEQQWQPMLQLQRCWIQRWILNPLCWAGDRTHAPALQRCHWSCCATEGTPGAQTLDRQILTAKKYLKYPKLHPKKYGYVSFSPRAQG